MNCYLLAIYFQVLNHDGRYCLYVNIVGQLQAVQQKLGRSVQEILHSIISTKGKKKKQHMLAKKLKIKMRTLRIYKHFQLKLRTIRNHSNIFPPSAYSITMQRIPRRSI